MLGEYEIMIYLMAEVYYQWARICHNGLKWSKKGFHDQWSHDQWKSFQIMRGRLSGLEAISDFYSKKTNTATRFEFRKELKRIFELSTNSRNRQIRAIVKFG